MVWEVWSLGLIYSEVIQIRTCPDKLYARDLGKLKGNVPVGREAVGEMVTLVSVPTVD